MFNNFNLLGKIGIVFILLLAVFLLAPAGLRAHCDRVNGPVAKSARQALKTGQFKPVAIWIGEEQEAALQDRFESSLKAYRAGGPGKKVAKSYFMSEAIRLHRAAEGMPFTGLKPASELPIDLKLAEKARETGDVQPVVDLLSSELEQKVKKWFKTSREARRQWEQQQNVETGRKWADAYVKYIIYVHKLYQKIMAGPPHGVGGKSAGSHGK